LEQDLFKSIVETSPNYIAVVQNGKFVYVNSLGQSLLNCSNPCDIIGKSIYEFLHPDIREVIIDRVENAICNRPNDTLNIKMITTGGKPVYLETRQSSFLYKESRAILFIGRNMTNGQTAGVSSKIEQTVLQNNKKIKKFAEYSPMGILLARWKVPTFINKTFLKLLGIRSMEDFLKINPFDLIHPDDRNPLNKILERIFDNDIDEPSSYQLTVRTSALYGLVKVLDLRVVAFRFSGKTDLQIMAIDITDEIEREKMIRELASESLHASQNKAVIAEIKKEMEGILRNKSHSFPMEFQNIQKLLDSLPKYENDWGLFNKRFEHLHPGFIFNLKIICPTLTINEIKHCACFRLNIDTKEIAVFFNVTPASIQKSRVRLKKKLGLPENVDLREFIENV